MSRIVSRIDPRSLTFKKNQGHTREMLKVLRDRIAHTTAGGPERLRKPASRTWQAFGPRPN